MVVETLALDGKWKGRRWENRGGEGNMYFEDFEVGAAERAECALKK